MADKSDAGSERKQRSVQELDAQWARIKALQSEKVDPEKDRTLHADDVKAYDNARKSTQEDGATWDDGRKKYVSDLNLHPIAQWVDDTYGGNLARAIKPNTTRADRGQRMAAIDKALADRRSDAAKQASSNRHAILSDAIKAHGEKRKELDDVEDFDLRGKTFNETGRHNRAIEADSKNKTTNDAQKDADTNAREWAKIDVNKEKAAKLETEWGKAYSGLSKVTGMPMIGDVGMSPIWGKRFTNMDSSALKKVAGETLMTPTAYTSKLKIKANEIIQSKTLLGQPFSPETVVSEAHEALVSSAKLKKSETPHGSKGW